MSEQAQGTLPGVETPPVDDGYSVCEIDGEELSLLLDIANAAAAAVLVDDQFYKAGPNAARVSQTHGAWAEVKRTVAAWQGYLEACGG